MLRFYCAKLGQYASNVAINVTIPAPMHIECIKGIAFNSEFFYKKLNILFKMYIFKHLKFCENKREN